MICGVIVINGTLLSFLCPGCKRLHTVNIDIEQSPVWIFNNDYHNPTFSPSICVRQSNNNNYCCHSIVTDGKIQFFQDSTHELAGQTIDLVCPY